MKKQYIIFSSAIIAIVFLQTFFIKSLYDNYIMAENEHIENTIIQAIDLELLSRKFNNKRDIKFMQDVISIDDMPQEMLDSILTKHPLPMAPPEFNYDVRELMNNEIITSSSGIVDHMMQDENYETGYPINIKVLDSLFDTHLERGYNNRIIIYNSSDSVLDKVDCSNTKYNYTSDIKQIGFKGYQFLQIDVYIPVSKFIKQSILIFILSFIVILIPLTSLFLLLTGIRRKTKQLEINEQNLNGTIHDMKSPLVSVKAMLNWFKIAEPDLKKKEAIIENTKRVNSLIKKAESLLDVVRYDKKRIVVCKEEVTSDNVIAIIDLVKQDLSLSYGYKSYTININNKIPFDRILYIDMMHCESILRNLIENALKYSSNNVNIIITLDINSKNNLKIKVADDGFGINKKHIKHLFEQFYRVPHEGKLIKGYGIGLSYVKAIAIAHGGSIRVQSTEGEGSEFEVILNIENR